MKPACCQIGVPCQLSGRGENFSLKNKNKISCRAVKRWYLPPITPTTPWSRLPRLIRLESLRNVSSLDQAAAEWPYLDTLLLAFFASQRRSSFAAKTFINVVFDLYQNAARWDDIQLELKLAGIQEGKHAEQLTKQARKHARLLIDIEKDAMLQWIALIFITLRILGVEQGPGNPSSLDETQEPAKGMQAFVKQTLALNYSLEKLQLQQQLAQQQGDGEVLPSVRLMQENTQLIVLTNEIVRGRQATQNADLTAAMTADTIPEASINQVSSTCQESASDAIGTADPDLRASAARALLAFLGAAKGSLYSVNAFVEEAFKCYMNGYVAHELHSAIRPEDFATGSTLFPVITAEGSGSANSQIFAQWISTIFMTLAQVGVPHSASKSDVGWAWADQGSEDDPMVASSISNFVSNTLKAEAETEGATVVESEALKHIRERSPELRRKSESSFSAIEDDSIRRSSSAFALMSQLRNLVILTRDVARRNTKEEQSKS